MSFDYNAPVALHPEGVDRNGGRIMSFDYNAPVALHPEGVDRNAAAGCSEADKVKSPSTRRAWIEIRAQCRSSMATSSRPPPGGRG